MSVKVFVPQIGQSIAEATIVKWFKKAGDAVEKGEILVEIGTDKINTEIPAPETGVVERLLVQEGETVPVQTEIAVIGADIAGAGRVPEINEKLSEHRSADKPREYMQGTNPGQVDLPSVNTDNRHSPLVRRLAQEHNIDLTKVRGTGEGGRITKADVQKVIDNSKETEPSSAEIVPMSRMRRLISEHMLLSKRSTAELTTFFEIDMTGVVQQRDKARDHYQKNYGLKLTYLPFVIAVVSQALRAYPALNASIQGESIHYKKDINIGIATAVEEGLIVPVLKKAGEKKVEELARAAADLADRARTRRLTPDDMSDGTFTITNPGVFGALMGTPIINYPQVAILGVGAVEKRAVVIQDAIEIRSMAYFSLTYDHRAMDGAVADSFMAHIKKTLETACPPAID